MNLYIINKEYLDYLRSFCPEVPYSDYGDRLKPFIGVLFQNDDNCFLVALSSIKEHQMQLKNNIDFQKIYLNDQPVAAINLNRMIPVPLSELTEIDYSKIDKYRSFTSIIDKSQYIHFLKEEMSAINKINLKDNAFKCYQHKIMYPRSSLSNRSLPYIDLECRCTEWILNKEFNIKTKITYRMGKFHIKDLDHSDKYVRYDLDTKEIIKNIQNNIKLKISLRDQEENKKDQLKICKISLKNVIFNNKDILINNRSALSYNDEYNPHLKENCLITNELNKISLLKENSIVVKCSNLGMPLEFRETSYTAFPDFESVMDYIYSLDHVQGIDFGYSKFKGNLLIAAYGSPYIKQNNDCIYQGFNSYRIELYPVEEKFTKRTTLSVEDYLSLAKINLINPLSEITEMMQTDIKHSFIKL